MASSKVEVSMAKQLRGMQIGQVVLADKIAPGKRGQSLDLTTNLWGIVPAKDLPVFRYDIRVLEEYPSRSGDGNPVMKEVTKQTREDYISIERKNKCVAVFRKIVEKEKKFFGKLESMVYDRASILYSLDQLKIGPTETKSFALLPRELPPETVNEECSRVHVHVKQCSEDFQLTTQDLKSAVNRTPDQINRSLLQFLELLVSQEAFFIEGRFVSYGTGQSYLMEPGNYGFSDRDMPSLPDGKYIGIGCAKGVRIVEGPLGSGNEIAALILDVKKAAFHIERQSLVDKISMILNRTDRVMGSRLSIEPHHVPVLSRVLRGLYVRCNYGKERAFAIQGIEKQSANQFRVEVDRQRVTVADYFRKKHNISLKLPQLPLVIERTPRGMNYYPMELLVVCENQRVTLTQQSAAQVQAMIRACATLPANRLQQTRSVMKAMALDLQAKNNRWMKEHLMCTTADSITLKGRLLPPPEIVYGNSAVVSVKDNTSWVAVNNRYIFPAKCQIWCAVALVATSDRFFNRAAFENYITAFMAQCSKRGMQISRPAYMEFVQGGHESDVQKHIMKAKQLGATFVHFIMSESFKYHGKLKLVEVQEQILTQNLLTKTAEQAPKKWQTLENIVNKTNLKLGGLNFDLRLESAQAQQWISRADRLIVGIDLAHPPVAAVKGQKKSAVPSVVGYASNCKRFPLEFIGGYRYARAEMEQLLETETSITEIICESLRNCDKNRNTKPAHIVILRDGVSEGQYKYIIEVEVEQVKRACKAVGGDKYRPHITFLVATKMHNIRIYRKPIPQGKAAEQNIPPGTVADEHIVNPKLTEFYLNSHSAFQGSAKTPRYNLMFDTSKMKADELQGLVYALSYDMQIVNAAVSIPAPVMIADCMAQRGRNNYIQKYGESSEGTDALPDLAALNAELGYVGKPLSAFRFNA